MVIQYSGYSSCHQTTTFYSFFFHSIHYNRHFSFMWEIVGFLFGLIGQRCVVLLSFYWCHLHFHFDFTQKLLEMEEHCDEYRPKLLQMKSSRNHMQGSYHRAKRSRARIKFWLKTWKIWSTCKDHWLKMPSCERFKHVSTRKNISWVFDCFYVANQGIIIWVKFHAVDHPTRCFNCRLQFMHENFHSLRLHFFFQYASWFWKLFVGYEWIA